MKKILIMVLIAFLSGCVSQNGTDDFPSVVSNSVLDPEYTAFSSAENDNSGGRFVTTIQFTVINDEITEGTVSKYSSSFGNESNTTFTLEEYKEISEFWRGEFHTQEEIRERAVSMLLVTTFKLGDADCFRLENDPEIQTIRLDASVCLESNSIAAYGERGDYGRGGYYWWYREGYENLHASLRQAGW